ncbi:MAG: YfiR family protein [Verrucomicrobia bacterium]|nr:YfiR family protein [Verrucomicrobiota bacterium]
MALLTAIFSGRGRQLLIRPWILLLLYAMALRTPAQAAPTREYEVKAVFLFNFAQFVDWPPQAFESPTSPIVIGVVGPDPFGGALEAAVRSELVNGRPLVVQRYRRPQDIGDCHVLFVASAVAGQMNEILARVKDHSVLTVGDSEGFTKGGGVIRFLNDKGRVRLRINVDAARAAHLKLSSKLLRPAEIIGTAGE